MDTRWEDVHATSVVEYDIDLDLLYGEIKIVVIYDDRNWYVRHMLYLERYKNLSVDEFKTIMDYLVLEMDKQLKGAGH